MGKQSKLHVGQNKDVIPLPGLETEIAVTGIHILHNRNNGMLVMYYNVSKVHECMAYRSKMTKTVIGVHNRGYYVSPHKIQDGLLLGLSDDVPKILSFAPVFEIRIA